MAKDPSFLSTADHLAKFREELLTHGFTAEEAGALVMEASHTVFLDGIAIHRPVAS